METAGYASLTVFLSFSALDIAAEYLNIRRLRALSMRPPAGLAEWLGPDFFREASSYQAENAWLRVSSSVFNDAILILFVFGGALNAYDSWLGSLHLGFIPSGVVFFLGIFYAGYLVNLPFGIYRVFGIEKRHGFGAMTASLMTKDILKSLALSTLFLTAILSGAMFLVESSPLLWWLFAWVFFLMTSVFVIYISPLVIEPLFNRFTPVTDEPLLSGLNAVCEKAGIRVERVLRMDASRRTSHTNAYFTGIGALKRIVVFDTLLERLGMDEVTAVVGHEAGHWKKRHLLKRLIITEAMALLALYVSYRLLEGPLLSVAFGLKTGSFFARAAVLAFLWGIAAYALRPALLYLSRRDEREADLFAARVTADPRAMGHAIMRLSGDNLANIDPHPLYALLNLTHPSPLERISRLPKNATCYAIQGRIAKL